MTALTFAPATKKALKARIALEGPSGSGKTMTSLLIARALGDRIALVDTERRSASLYADLFRFDTLPLERFAPDILIEALAAAGGHDVCIVDSFSHFWMGTDGMLEQVDRAAKKSASGNTFAGWKDIRPVERKMIDAMLAYPGHLIVTLRTKSEWVVEENDRGKKAPKKIGLKAEQREGLEYEFTVVGTMDLENTLVVTKSRCPALSGEVIAKPDEQFGRTLLNWLDDGESAGESAAQLRDEILANPHASREDFLAYYQRGREAGLLGTAIVNEHADTVTLGEWIVERGKPAAAPAAAAPQPAPSPAREALEQHADELMAAYEAPAQPERRMVNDGQHRNMHAIWNELGFGGDHNRTNRLTIMSKILDRPVETSKSLTEDEAEGVIAALESKRRELKNKGAAPQPTANEGPMTADQRTELFARLKTAGLDQDKDKSLAAINQAIAPATVTTTKQLTEFQAAQVIGYLKAPATVPA